VAKPRDGRAEAPEADASIAKLAELFLAHPAWVRAAQMLGGSASSAVYFSHRPGEPWRLESREGKTRLRPGRAPHPDFAFCFTPASIDRLARARGGVGGFAVELFSLLTQTDPDLRIGFRIIAPFAILAKRGYVQLLVAGGWQVLAFGAARGVRTLADLRRLVKRLRASEPEPWET
jgi:hypothetical protein